MNRRHFVLGATAVAGVLRANPVFAQTNPLSDIEMVSELPPLPPDLASAAEAPAPYTEMGLVGTGKPSDAEVNAAYDILINSPFDAAPVDVAQYFLAVGAGAFGKEYRPYAREWPVRANPTIFHFFSATQTKPEGDVTAWCAAFLNWCLLRAHVKSKDEIGKSPGAFSRSGKQFSPQNLARFSTNNASSGSFRCWSATPNPSRGDIVVFKDPGTDSLTSDCRGTGHVAFFLQIPASDVVQVLGGNQTLAGSNGAVTVANMKTTPGSRFMKYVTLKVA
jgi:hypothetical protein